MNDMRSSHDPHVWPPLAAATNDMIEFDHMLLALLPFLMVPNNDCSDTATVTAESSSLHDSDAVLLTSTTLVLDLLV
jgi:hypothetical protein